MKNIIMMLIVVIIYTWVDDKGVTYLTNYAPPEGAIVLINAKDSGSSYLRSWSTPVMRFADVNSSGDVNITIEVPKPEVIIIKTIRKRGRKSFHEYSKKRHHWNKKRGK